MEMRNGIDTPHVNVIYPSGLATNMEGGRAAYFSIPSPTIYIPDGAIDWRTFSENSDPMYFIITVDAEDKFITEII